jgi:hypothetical protein
MDKMSIPFCQLRPIRAVSEESTDEDYALLHPGFRVRPLRIISRHQLGVASACRAHFRT